MAAIAAPLVVGAGALAAGVADVAALEAGGVLRRCVGHVTSQSRVAACASAADRGVLAAVGEAASAAGTHPAAGDGSRGYRYEV